MAVDLLRLKSLQTVYSQFYAWSVLNRRRQQRVSHRYPLRGILTDRMSGKKYHCWLNTFSRRGFFVMSRSDLRIGGRSQLSFRDRINGMDLSVPVDIRCEVKRKRVRSTRFHRLKIYRCLISPGARNDSDTYVNYYQRNLADSFIHDLNRNKQKLSNSGNSGKVQIKIAVTAEEKEAAWKLIYKEYAKRGFAKTNPFEIFTYKFLLLPSTVTFIGVRQSEVY
ncbi:MAG TPA: PilZ domain-containing protein, partial [bacterium]|nr:PilZ domain-containing protein [bacterium]